ncbi:MAG TPA: methylated-DNA--[protein]-cysteine S-methyltransferase [Acidobacteriota bacterium]|nr:methylated-DNA--[protein]-cysteine S-methyltransferase [Acidobacteriota bacterium]
MIAPVRLSSPPGELVAAFSERGLACLVYLVHKKRSASDVIAALFKDEEIGGEAPLAGPLRRQLDEYFTGVRKTFDIPLDLRGTPFQLGVWRELEKIPYGSVVKYGELASRLGSTARAVGGACGANPVSIIVPCHRVIGSDGGLRGYGGGLETKRFLLEMEGALPPRLIP